MPVRTLMLSPFKNPPKNKLNRHTCLYPMDEATESFRASGKAVQYSNRAESGTEVSLTKEKNLEQLYCSGYFLKRLLKTE